MAESHPTMSPIDLAYIAGFFDGEGSITIHHNCRPSPRGISPNHTLQVSIGNTDPRVLRWIHEAYKGRLVYRKAPSPRHRHICQWIVRAAQTLPFLKDVRPYLRMKADQADVAIRYQETKWLRGPKRVTPADICWREEQRAKIRELNARAWVQFA